jgi:CubicO group peptidase (beta-lactamase class C family)
LGRRLRDGLLLATVALASATAQPAPQPGLEPNKAEVEGFLRRLMQTRKIPGLQIAVVQHGKVVFLGAYGVANVEDSVPVSDDTVFPVHSITKAFVGVAVMQLVEAGKLDLGAPVSRYLDGLPTTWQAITLRQLLTHVSGLPELWDKHLRVIADTEAGLWSKLQSMPLEFPAGERFSYNQTNYFLLGKVISKVSGEPVLEFIAERQFNVVGMPSSGFGDAHDVVPHISGTYCYCTESEQGTVASPRLTVFLRDWPVYIRTAAGLNTTAQELAKWIVALREGRLLKKESLATLWTPGRLNDGSARGTGDLTNGYALGWPIAIRPEHRAIASTGGNRAAFFIYPEDDLAVIILTNLVGSGPEQFVDEVAGYYIPGMRASGFGLSPTVRVLRSELLKQGFEHAPEAARALKAKDKHFTLSESDLINWAYQLLELGEVQKSIEIFKLSVTLFPKSGNTYDSLAEAYEVAGDKQKAISNYRRSLELDPANANAVEHLTRLGARP